ncbi:MAG: hypothetical protein AAF528_09390, partial [Cyanobacteria bacterium P01_C01_bin.121]
MTALTRYRWLCFTGLGVMVAFGVAKTVYHGWGYPMMLEVSGDVLHEMAWIWFVGAWQVRWPVKWIAIFPWKGFAIATFLLTSLI